MTYELDGGARGWSKRLKADVVPGGITVCVPEPAAEPARDGAAGDESDARTDAPAVATRP
jgi:hypothetical protein